MKRLQDPQILNKIAKLGSLPTLPALAAEIGRVAADPDSSASDVARLVSSDPTFALRVLKIANSAFFRLPSGPVSDIQAAVVILGLNTVKAIAVGLGLCSSVWMGGPNSAFDRKRFLRHSLASGFGAKATATAARLADQEAAFLAGLLHDMGKPVLDTLDPRQYKRVLRALKKTEMPPSEVEKGILGFDHAQLGYEAAVVWGVSKQIARAVLLHHRDELPDSTQGKLARCAQCGDAAARRMGLSFPDSEQMSDAEFEKIFTRAGLPPEHMDRVLRAASQSIREIEDLVGVFDIPGAESATAA